MPPGRSSPPPYLASADKPLHAEQIRLLFRFSLVGYLATLLVVLILGAILWEDLSRPALFAWFIAVAMVAIGRYLIYKAFIQGNPPDDDMSLWEGRFIAGTVLAGLCWMMLGTLLLPDSARLAQRLSVVMLVTLLMTGAVAYYAPHRYVYKITVFLGLVPLAATLRATGDRTPILALTANAFAEDRKLCLEAGMDDHLVKPLEPERLRAALARWTNRELRAKVA